MSRAARLVLLALALGFAGGCVREKSARGILLITLDTTRADRLGCYGYERAETPALDALAAEGTRFTEAQASVPVTLPSHASMFTGQYPPAHGVRYNGMFKLGEESVTVAELLRDAGWSTAAVPASFPVNAKTGLGQGFETYMDMFGEQDAKELPLDAERKASDVVRLGLDWLRQRTDQRVFLWLHLWDPHSTYAPPFPQSARFRERPYDGEIAYVDQELGKLFAELRRIGLWDELLVVVAGDHGEGLFDHGEAFHSTLDYQSTLHVPLIIKAPGRVSARVLDEPVSLVDIAPTILDFAGLPAPAKAAGISLRPALGGKALPRRTLYHEALAGSLVYGWSPLEGVRHGTMKYIDSIKPELYNLQTDPGERVNLYGTQRSLAQDLKSTLEADLARWHEQGSDAQSAAVPLDSEELARLATLGYVGGTIAAERRGGPHPPDVVHLEAAVVAARGLDQAGDYQGALRALAAVLAEDPGNRLALMQAAYAANKLGDLDQAIQFAGELVKIYPEFLPGSVVLGEMWITKGELGHAADVFRASLEHHPTEDALTYRLALTLLMLGRVDEAAAQVEQAIASGADQPAFLVARAVCRAKQGDSGGAIEALDEAIAKGYRDREALEKEPLLAPLRSLPGFAGAIGGLVEG